MNKKILLLILLGLVIFIGFKGASASNTTGDTHTLEGDIGEYSVVRLDKVNFVSDNETYLMKVISVGKDTIKVKYLRPNGDIFYATINVDETAKTDLNYDSTYDVSMTLKSTSFSRAQIIFEVLNENGQTKKEFEAEQKALDALTAKQNALSSGTATLIVIAIILVLMSAIVYWRVKTRK